MIPFFISILEGKGDSEISYFKHNCLLCWNNYLQSELSSSESSFNNMPTSNTRFFSKSLRNYRSVGAFFTTFFKTVSITPFTTFTTSTSSVTCEILMHSRQRKFLKHFRQLVFKRGQNYTASGKDNVVGVHTKKLHVSVEV
jgi:hypothetical protein